MKRLFSIIIGISIVLACGGQKQTDDHPVGDTKQSTTIVDAQLKYQTYLNQKSLLQKLNDNSIILSDSSGVFIYRDTLGHVRLGVKYINHISTWEILETNHAEEVLVWKIDRVDFDKGGRDEVIIEKEIRNYYSSMGSSHSGYMEIWSIDRPSLLFSLENYFLEAPGRNGDGPLIECELKVEIMPSLIKVTKPMLSNETDCADIFHLIGEYCLVGKEVIKCD